MIEHFTHKRGTGKPHATRASVSATALCGSAQLSGRAMKPRVRTKCLQSTLPMQATATYAGDIAKTIEDVEKQRLTYLVDTLDLRAATGDSPRGLLVKAGDWTGAGYTPNTCNDSPLTVQAYLQSHRSPTCRVPRMRPWRMTIFKKI